MMGKIKSRRRRLDGITDAMKMNLGKLWEMVRDREAWRAAGHGLKRQDGDYRTVTRSQKLGQGLLAAGQMAFFLMQKLKLQYFGHLMQLTGQVPDAGKD